MRRHGGPLALTKVTEKTISVDSPKTLESLLAKYLYVSDVYSSEKKQEITIPYRAEFCVWELRQSMAADEIRRELAEHHMRPATAVDLLCFADAHPEACDPALVATGSGEHIARHTGVPVVTIRAGGDSRAGEMFVERFAVGTHVLSVKAQQAS